MRKPLVGVAALCLLVPAIALASVSTSGFASVVLVDVKAKSITVRSTLDGKDVDMTAKWNEKTEWFDDSLGYDNRKDATADLVKSFKEGTTIYVRIEDGVFERVVLKPPAKKE
jgi:hypothetical protein